MGQRLDVKGISLFKVGRYVPSIIGRIGMTIYCAFLPVTSLSVNHLSEHLMYCNVRHVLWFCKLPKNPQNPSS